MTCFEIVIAALPLLTLAYYELTLIFGFRSLRLPFRLAHDTVYEVYASM